MIRSLLILVPWLFALLGYLAEGADGLRAVALTWLLAAPMMILIAAVAFQTKEKS